MFKLLVFITVCLSSIKTIESYGHNNVPCPCGWKKILNGCYLFEKAKVTWGVARANCLKQGGDLVVPKGALQCILLSNHSAILGMHAPWIGVFRHRHGGKFYDTCGKPLSYAPWAPKEPNDLRGVENCGQMYGKGESKAKWNDNGCNEKWGYICQIKLPRCD